MAIIDLTPAPLTPDEILQRQVDALKNEMNRQYRQNVRVFSNAARFVWQNPSFTPAEVLAKFGTDAADLFKLSGAFVGMMDSYQGTTTQVIPDGYVPTIHEDGAVTVIYTPPENP